MIMVLASVALKANYMDGNIEGSFWEKHMQLILCSKKVEDGSQS